MQLSEEFLLCHQAGVKPNVRTYTALITALGNAKQWKRALHTLQRLKTDMSAARVEPNAYTYSALLKTMGEHGQWALAEQVPCHSNFDPAHCVPLGLLLMREPSLITSAQSRGHSREEQAVAVVAVTEMSKDMQDTMPHAAILSNEFWVWRGASV